MPTNQQRREAAKRKLQRQLVRRKEQERRRRQRLIIVGIVAAVLIASGATWLIVASRSETPAAGDNGAGTTASSSAEPATPCSYPQSGSAAKEVSPPTNLSPLNSGTVPVEITLNGEAVPITLDRESAPCGVNAFLSLASQGFYNQTTCHRLTVSAGLNVLQCGDPTGAGNGGPGFNFATEVDPAATYPVGTVALANAGVGNTNGSQFFIVYRESTLPPSYSILGSVNGDGMAVIDRIAAGGTANNAQDGPPANTATIDNVTVPPDALEGTGVYETTTPAAPEAVPSGLLPETGAPAGGEAVPEPVPPSTPGAG